MNKRNRHFIKKKKKRKKNSTRLFCQNDAGKYFENPRVGVYFKTGSRHTHQVQFLTV